MKEAKFIELLNLYLDQQIDPQDAELLEQEILRRPDRRRTYLEYCRVHRACGLVLAASAEQGVGSRLGVALAEADSKLLEFPEARNPFRKYVFWAGGLMATAAAIAVILALRTAGGGGQLAASAPQEEIVQIEALPVMKFEDRAYTVPLVSRGAWTSNRSSELDWLRELRLEPLAPVSVSNVRIVAENDGFRNDDGGRRMSADAVENTAFQIQR